MKKSEFTEEQIAFALRQAQAGTRVEEVCRKFGVSQAKFYNRSAHTVRSCRSLDHQAG
jgi:putative transposase